jgi:glycolate oxidase
MTVALDLGGTVTGEHGVGTLKARHLATQLGPDVMEITRAVKAALDPTGILNPGKWV